MALFIVWFQDTSQFSVPSHVESSVGGQHNQSGAAVPPADHILNASHSFTTLTKTTPFMSGASLLRVAFYCYIMVSSQITVYHQFVVEKVLPGLRLQESLVSGASAVTCGGKAKKKRAGKHLVSKNITVLMCMALDKGQNSSNNSLIK